MNRQPFPKKARPHPNPLPQGEGTADARPVRFTGALREWPIRGILTPTVRAREGYATAARSTGGQGREAARIPLSDHPAVRAWNQLRADSIQPREVHPLKEKMKSAAYRLTDVGPNDADIIAKRSAAANIQLEELIYREILSRMSLPGIRCHGAVADSDSSGKFYWIFLDEARGSDYSPARKAHQTLAGRWLAALHTVPIPAEVAALLPARGPGHWLALLRSAHKTVADHVNDRALSSGEAALLRTIVENYSVVEGHWDDLEREFQRHPRALVHGDLVKKNLRVHTGAAEPVLWVFDWEMSGWGVPASDLAYGLRCAGPDLKAYWSAFRGAGRTEFELNDIQRLANYGQLLRVVNEIYWAATKFGRDRHEWLVAPLLSLREFQQRLAAAMRALKWL